MLIKLSFSNKWSSEISCKWLHVNGNVCVRALPSTTATVWNILWFEQPLMNRQACQCHSEKKTMNQWVNEMCYCKINKSQSLFCGSLQNTNAIVWWYPYKNINATKIYNYFIWDQINYQVTVALKLYKQKQKSDKSWNQVLDSFWKKQAKTKAATTV